MPIHPIGKVGRKGSLGSYYAVRDYRQVNPEFGTLRDFDRVVRRCHELDLKVILDWVPNHTAWDHRWISEHPEWYRRNDEGAIVPPVPDWRDVAQLDYGLQASTRLSPAQRELWSTMQQEMAFWVEDHGVDGFRCDVASFLPMRFWRETRRKLRRAGRELFWLAEADGPELHDRAFDASYGWTLQRGLDEVAAGKLEGRTLIRRLRREQKEYPSHALRMQMTSNHDANSWDGSALTRLGAAGAEAGAVLSFVFPGIPLIYGGQEAGLRHRLAFFEKDEIPWGEHRFQRLYRALAGWRRNHTALASDPNAGFRFLRTSDEDTLAFVRENGDQTLVGVFLLRPQAEVTAIEVHGLTEIVASEPSSSGLQRILSRQGRGGSTPPRRVSVRRAGRLRLCLGPWGFAVWTT